MVGLKTDDAEEAWNPDGLVPRTVQAIKARFPELGVITDVALDPYTSHGQDGLIDADRGYVMNDETLEALARAGAVPRAGRCRRGRAVRHDGWSHRPHPQRA
jgi:delta-aminolevulinic acid dehydratase/porphobilinogen synthase